MGKAIVSLLEVQIFEISTRKLVYLLYISDGTVPAYSIHSTSYT